MSESLGAQNMPATNNDLPVLHEHIGQSIVISQQIHELNGRVNITIVRQYPNGAVRVGTDSFKAGYYQTLKKEGKL